MPRSGRKGQRPNEGSEYAPAKQGRKENLTKDDIPTIVEAVLNSLEAHGNTNRGSERPATRSSRCQITRGSDDKGSHHARETSSGIANDPRDDTANDTGDDTAGTTDQNVGEYNYVLFTLAEYHTGGTSSRDESDSFFVPSRIFRLTLLSKSSFTPRGFLPVRYS